ncbi:hypothetical protein, partial [Psychroserpens mesophilus]|uniref:hypothetical protein n=1 Tax=Psychroserpens mesophilus TaxID=325473 RepID=UPI003D64F145
IEHLLELRKIRSNGGELLILVYSIKQTKMNFRNSLDQTVVMLLSFGHPNQWLKMLLPILLDQWLRFFLTWFKFASPSTPRGS